MDIIGIMFDFDLLECIVISFIIYLIIIINKGKL
nr:MAG TPA: hypothetical protein [Caudoviricetes sp.]